MYDLATTNVWPGAGIYEDRQALLAGTPWPVKEWALYSLRLGEAFVKYDEGLLKYDKIISNSRERKA